MWSVSCFQLQPMAPAAASCSHLQPEALSCRLKLQANEAVKLSTRCWLQLPGFHMDTPAVHRCSWSLGVADHCSQLKGCCQEQLCWQDWVTAVTQVRERDSFQLQERGLSEAQVRGLCRLH